MRRGPGLKGACAGVHSGSHITSLEPWVVLEDVLGLGDGCLLRQDRVEIVLDRGGKLDSLLPFGQNERVGADLGPEADVIEEAGNSLEGWARNW